MTESRNENTIYKGWYLISRRSRFRRKAFVGVMGNGFKGNESGQGKVGFRRFEVERGIHVCGVVAAAYLVSTGVDG